MGIKQIESTKVATCLYDMEMVKLRSHCRDYVISHKRECDLTEATSQCREDENAVSQRKVPVKKAPEIEIIMPGRGTTGPIRIGRLLEPIGQIINHPDRNRLMAELFKDYK